MARLRQHHALWLMGLGAALPLGEGVSYVGMLGVFAMLIRRRAAVNSAALRHAEVAPLLGALLLYVLAGLVALGIAPFGLQHPAAWARLLSWALLPLMLLSASCLPRRALRHAAWAFVVSLSLSALVGLLQWAGNARPWEALVRADYGQAEQALVPGLRRAVVGGFYVHRLKMAHVLVVGVGISLAGLLFGRARRGLFAALGLLQLAALGLTYARGACLAAALGGTSLVLHRWPLRRRHVPLAVALGVATLLALGVLQARRVHPGRPLARAAIWTQAVEIGAAQPQGVGLGNYAAVVAPYYDALPPNLLPRTLPHNMALAAWTQTGPLGLVAWGFISWWPVQLFWRRLRRTRCTVAAAGLFGWVGLFGLGLAHDVLFHHAVALVYCGLLGLCLAYPLADKDSAHAHAG